MRKARGTGPDLKPPSVEGDLALELIEEDRPDGQRPGGHVALDDVEQLRQFIEGGLEELADQQL